jgi:plasmid maintenance system killer protein
MQVVFKDGGLERMEQETDFHGDFESTVADEFRHRLQILRSADSEERLLSLKALDMQRLATGNTNYRMRVTDQFGLDLEFREGEERRDRCVIVTRMSPNHHHNNNKGDLS